MKPETEPAVVVPTTRLRRRTVLCGAAVAAAAVGERVWGSAAEPPLDRLDPFGDIENFAVLRPYLFDAAGGKHLVSRLWEAYTRSGRREYGEWAVVYVFPWWRTMIARKDRVSVARIGQKMAQKLAADHPSHVAGYQWAAIHVGTEILSVGVIDALNQVSRMRTMLEKATAIDAGYFYGLPKLILAKAYAKLPPFPVSIGNLGRARDMLEELRPRQAHVFAIWHLFLAETMYLQGDPDGALSVLAEIEAAVTPENGATAYVLESTLGDAATLSKRIQDGTYERYLWDPLLEPARALPA
ncbi:MAG: hypothetical protein D6761_04975 [Candidatus Dadabacteria bacterium]|nr:MAG: hypothetical protein D6761_04975 [Candidatus Dadabacteria bacterium]